LVFDLLHRTSRSGHSQEAEKGFDELDVQKRPIFAATSISPKVKTEIGIPALRA
jgi:hypothetical protein